MRAAVQTLFLVTSSLRSEQMDQGPVHLFLEEKNISQTVSCGGSKLTL